MNKLRNLLLLAALAALPARASVLFQDSLNYPYTNGCIESQGQWSCYYPTAPYLDARVTNNVLILNTSHHDEVEAPLPGWSNSTFYNFAAFTVTMNNLPGAGGGYFFQFQDLNATNHCCHLFASTHDADLPGTYRLGIANYATSFAALVPPHDYPMDLAPGIPYTVVVLFDTNPSDPALAGATLWINPSEQDWLNAANGLPVISPGVGQGFVYGTDTTSSQSQANLTVSQVGFSPYASVSISNVIVGTAFEDVNLTNAPVIGIQPVGGTNYSGNSLTLYTVASGIDLTYQWYSKNTGALHDDGVNIIGSTGNVLNINNFSASDEYYVIVTDVYGQTATSQSATNSVITTPTPPFFPASVVAQTLTNNIFTTSGFTNTALGTGPLAYQWYFAPTNTPTVFSPLPGQNAPGLSLYLADYGFSGNYYVTVSSPLGTASGPTNTLVEIAPVVATIAQLHNLMISMTSQIQAAKSSTLWVNTNGVTVGGYVTTYGGFGSTYTEFFIQDASGYGIQVYLGPNMGNTNTPPIGTYVNVTGPVEIYHTELEIVPTSAAAIVPTAAPALPIGPVDANALFNDLSTNALGTNAMLKSCALVTFTNVYIYQDSKGTPVAPGGIFRSNNYTLLYFTQGPYHYPDNTNWIESYQFGYNYGTAAYNNLSITPIGGKVIPSHCSQITGAYLSYGGTPEILPSRLADYLTTPPATFQTTITEGKNGTTLTWPVQAGSSYTVWSKTNLLGSWRPVASGLNYYPASGTFLDTNRTSASFYRITSP